MKVNKFVHRMSTARMARTSHPTFGKGMARPANESEDEIELVNKGMATGTSRKRELTGDMGTKCVAHLKEPLRSKYTKVCLDLRDSIYDEDFYDDGTYAPMMIRLCVHACLTWDKNTNTGGIEGATMRFKPEKSDALISLFSWNKFFVKPMQLLSKTLSKNCFWMPADTYRE